MKTMIPCVNDLFESENEVYFQQDEPLPHFHANVRNFLDRTFNQKWIGWRGSAIKFLLQSPDLTPLDFYLWGTLKNMVFWRNWKIRMNMPSVYFITNNPYSMSLCSMSLLGVYCGRRLTFWTCMGLRKFKE